MGLFLQRSYIKLLYGQALYFTDSQLDVNENYATDQGHDIRGRLIDEFGR